MTDGLREIEEGSHRLDRWIEARNFEGWDPHDALNSPIVRALTFGNRHLGIAWIQLVKRSPWNLRRVLGVATGRNPKAMGLFLASYLRRYAAHGAEQDLERARGFVTWLLEHTSRGYVGACWGYNFDWANRNFFARAGTPTLVNTAFNGLALLDAAAVDPDAAGAARALAAARSACDFILRDLWSDRPAPDEIRLSYTPNDRHCVHNANVLGAALLAAVAARTSELVLADAALAACRYTARRQRPDGSWPYSEDPRSSWIDNFHTGYVLVALARVAEVLSTPEFDAAIARGYDYWKRTMFLDDGTPKYYDSRVYPIDAHCVAQAILTFVAFRHRDPEALPWARRVALWGVRCMQDGDGFFHYQIQPRYRIRIPYMRWTQAWMQRGLSELVYGPLPERAGARA